MGEFSQGSVVALRDQIRDGSPKVPKESLALFRRFDHAASEGGKPGIQIISPTLLEFLPHERGPVLVAVLPAVAEDVLQRGAGKLRGILDHGTGHAVLEVACHGCAAELVDFQTAPRPGGGELGARRSVADAGHCPLARRRGPLGLAREVDDFIGPNGAFRSNGVRREFADVPVYDLAHPGLGLVEPRTGQADVGKDHLVVSRERQRLCEWRRNGHPDAEGLAGDRREGRRPVGGDPCGGLETRAILADLEFPILGTLHGFEGRARSLVDQARLFPIVRLGGVAHCGDGNGDRTERVLTIE